MGKLVCGVGLNDADYFVSPVINGVKKWCPFYRTWYEMLKRCYSVKYKTKFPTYNGCTVCDEWLLFSNFKQWMEKQDWQGKQLDKDLLIRGNKRYSPETCVFVTPLVNYFLLDCSSTRGKWPIGVTLKKDRFYANCRNPFTKKKEHLGCFQTKDEAHNAWKKRKHELSKLLASKQENKKVVDALHKRYI